MSGTTGQPDEGGSETGPSLDISKLGDARPTRIPHARTFEEIAPVKRVDKPKFWICSGVFFACLIIAYLTSFWGQMVFNDPVHFRLVQDSQTDQSWWMGHWCKSVLEPLSEGWLEATYAWDLKSFPWNAAWSHAVNVTLHLTACIYLYLLVFRLSWRFVNDGRLKANPYVVALSAALLLAVHPLTSGAVGYISGREGPLLAANYFLAANCFVFGFLCESMPLVLLGYMLALAFMIVGLMCSAQSITFPLFTLVLFALLKPPLTSWKEWFQDRGLDMVIFVAAGIAAPFAIALGTPQLIDNGVGTHLLGPAAYVASQFKVLVCYYLRCTVAPLGLSVEPPWATATGWADPLSLLGLLCVIGTGIAIWYCRKRPLCVLGLSLFLIGLLPGSFMVQHEVVADQRFYLSLSGLSIALSPVFGTLAASNMKRAIIVLASCVAVFSALTIWRNYDWYSDINLWKQALSLNPSSARAHAMYAEALYASGKGAEMLAEAKQAMNLDAQLAPACAAMGRANMFAKDYAAAAQNFIQAIDCAKRDQLGAEQIAYYQKDLARQYLSLNQIEKAKEPAALALNVLKDDPTMMLIMGNYYLAHDKAGEALSYLYKGAQKDPGDADFILPLMRAGLDSGLGQGAEIAYMEGKRAIAIKPGPDTQLLYCRAAVSVGRVNEVLPMLQQLAERPATRAQALFMLGVAAGERGNPAAAAQLQAQAVAIDPEIAEKLHMRVAKRPTRVNLNEKPSANTKPDAKPDAKPASTAAGTRGAQPEAKAGVKPDPKAKP